MAIIDLGRRKEDIAHEVTGRPAGEKGASQQYKKDGRREGFMHKCLKKPGPEKKKATTTIQKKNRNFSSEKKERNRIPGILNPALRETSEGIGSGNGWERENRIK